MTLFNTEGEIEQAKKPPLADRKHTAKAAVLSYTRNGAVKDRESPGKRKGELQMMDIDMHLIFYYFYH